MKKVGELQVGQSLVVIGGEEIRIREQACKKCRGVGKTVAVDGWSLERMRLREKVTARVVAKEMKVSPAFVYMIETNRRRCTGKTAERYVAAVKKAVAKREEGRR